MDCEASKTIQVKWMEKQSKGAIGETVNFRIRLYKVNETITGATMHMDIEIFGSLKNEQRRGK